MRTRFSAQQLRIVVPEWKGIIPDDSQGEPAVYAKPFTLADEKHMRKWIDSSDNEGFLVLIVRKATDEGGEKLFDAQDKLIMRENCEHAVIQRLGMALLGDPDTVEDAEGNSNATQSSKASFGSRPRLAEASTSSTT